MPAVCAVAVALLCAPWADDTRLRMETSSFGQGASIETRDGVVDFFYGTDDLFTAGWDTAARFCRADHCIEYRREDRGLHTTFMIRGADCDVGRRIEVRGASLASRDALLDAFGVIPPHGARAEAVSLAELSERRPLSLPREERIRDRPPANLACTD